MLLVLGLAALGACVAIFDNMNRVTPSSARYAGVVAGCLTMFALARAYYNEIATAFATRLEIVPDRFVAALAGMKPVPLLHAKNFERATVIVKFA